MTFPIHRPRRLRRSEAAPEPPRPVMLAIAGDSAAGKTTLTRGIAEALGADRAIALCVDDYHRYDRVERRNRVRDSLSQHRLRLFQGGDALDRRLDLAAELLAAARELAGPDDRGEGAAVTGAVRRASAQDCFHNRSVSMIVHARPRH